MSAGQYQISTRRVTFRYIVALLLIALSAISSHVVLNLILIQHKRDGAIINETGRMRMRSQRIASLCMQHTMGNESAKLDLDRTIYDFEGKYARYRDTDLKRQLSSDAYGRILKLCQTSLDQQVEDYLVAAKHILTQDGGSGVWTSEVTQVADLARLDLLNGLDQIVEICEEDSAQKLDYLGYFQWAALLLILVTLVAEAFFIFRPMIQSMGAVANRLLRMALTDELTGALNRRAFLKQAQIEMERARRYNSDLCVLMLDLDHFKNINDTYGHAAGDVVLARISEQAQYMLRGTDVLGRMGGEEFAILLPNTSLQNARRISERLRKSIRVLQIKAERKTIFVTVSIGISLYNAEQMTVVGDFLDQADQALYQAKNSGRDKVVIASGNALV